MCCSAIRFTSSAPENLFSVRVAIRCWQERLASQWPHFDQQQLLWVCGSVPGVPWIAEGYLERPPLARSSWRLERSHQQPTRAIFLRTTSSCSVACTSLSAGARTGVVH